jgi:hypothetical protein
MVITYKDFKIDESRMKESMKMVDDFEKHLSDDTMEVDVVKLALAHISACKFLTPMTHDQANFLKRITSGSWIGPLSPVLKPNAIESRHIVASGRVRNLVHGGMLGLLAIRFVHDPTQINQRRRNTYDALSIIQRANNEAGFTHVKYSIHEFQCKHNVGSKHFKVPQFSDLTHDQALEKFNSLDTLEHRERFLEEYRTLQQTDAMTHSRIIQACADNESDVWILKSARAMNDEWIAQYFGTFSATCQHKMKLIGHSTPLTQSCLNLVDLYRLIARIDWLLTDPNLRSIVRLNSFYKAFLKRSFYMAKEGVEHAAYVFMRFFPEMMTPELHMHMIPKWEIASSIGMHIEQDDPLFGSMKLACQSFMPVAQPPPPRPQSLCRDCLHWGCDGYDCRYDNDYDDYDDYDDDDDYSDDDNAQG